MTAATPPPDVICRLCDSEADRATALRIRFEVFVDEQGVPPELEPDEYDAHALHLLALAADTGKAIGTARIIVDRGAAFAKIGRVAVRRPHRDRGIGTALMVFALEQVRALGLTTVVLDAQVSVIPFYERLGFIAEGPIFDDASIPHRRMTKRL